MSLHSPTSVNGEALSPSPSTNGPLTVVIDDLNRPPRLPRWTRQEILVLIQGKRVVESRVRRVGRAANPSSDGSAPAATVEPKWASVAAYCRRHGVSRGPVQCRKRWSNLAVDFKKIKEWESKAADGSDSFWIMRSDVRRQKKLPGFFDREVYEILDGGDAAEKAKIEEEVDDDRGQDVGGGEDGLGGEFEQSGREGAVREELGDGGVAAPVPISEKQHEPEQRCSDPGFNLIFVYPLHFFLYAHLLFELVEMKVFLSCRNVVTKKTSFCRKNITDKEDCLDVCAHLAGECKTTKFDLLPPNIRKHQGNVRKVLNFVDETARNVIKQTECSTKA